MTIDAIVFVLMLHSPGANEYYSGFDNIGHNNLYDLVVLWILPK